MQSVKKTFISESGMPSTSIYYNANKKIVYDNTFKDSGHVNWMIDVSDWVWEYRQDENQPRAEW